MARPGRKRKAGQREPSGRLQRDYSRDIGTPELGRKHAAMKGKGTLALVTDQMAAAGLLTDQQQQAADCYRELRNLAFGKPNAKIANYSEMISEGTLRAIVEMDASKDPQARAEQAYCRGHRLVMETCYLGATVELTQVVIDNQPPTVRGHRALQQALDVLHGLYFAGIDERTTRMA